MRSRKLFSIVIAVAAAALIVVAVCWREAAIPGAVASVAPPPPTSAMTVTTAVVRRVQWASTVDASGSIEAWQEAVVGAQSAGLRLSEVRVDVGDRVVRGQLLARFDTAMLRAQQAQLQAALAQAEAASTQAEGNRRRAISLRESRALSEQDVLQKITDADIAAAQLAGARAQLAAKQLELGYADVVAPDDGIISARSATLGAVGASGQELFRLIRQGRLEWRGELTASQLAQVRIGQAVELTLPDGRPALAKLRQIAPTLDAPSRLARVYADLDSHSRARAGMYAGGRIVLEPSAALVLPVASLAIRDGRSYVYELDDRGSRVAARAVRVGRRQGAEVEIVQGVEEGARVVVDGAGFLADGDFVSVVPEPRAATPAAQAGT